MSRRSGGQSASASFATAKAELQSKQNAAINVHAVAQRAGVTRRTVFYRHKDLLGRHLP